MEAQTSAQRQPRIQNLENHEDLQLLKQHDVVSVYADSRGGTIHAHMAVVEHPEACRVLPGRISLIHRIWMDGIYHIDLPLEKTQVVNGKLRFDYTKGEVISIWGRDWVYFDKLMHDLEDAGLE